MHLADKVFYPVPWVWIFHGFSFITIIYLYIYFGLLWVFAAVHQLSLVAVSGAHSLVGVCFSIEWLLLLHSIDYKACRLQYLWHPILIALQHVEFSLTRDQTCVLCIGRWILNQWTIREILSWIFNNGLDEDNECQMTIVLNGNATTICNWSSVISLNFVIPNPHKRYFLTKFVK